MYTYQEIEKIERGNSTGYLILEFLWLGFPVGEMKHCGKSYFLMLGPLLDTLVVHPNNSEI